MSLSSEVAPELPFLRRYARALTGNQRSGDAYVQATLEALVADPTQLIVKGSPRLPLYRFFHTIWDSTHIGGLSEIDDTLARKTAHARLSSLVPERRQALLLTALEGFSHEEAGHILNRTPNEIHHLIDAAMMDISRETSTEALIIEDEPVIALDLANIVKELGHKVIQIASTRDEAVKAARRHRPGLILADIKLADDSSGIDAVKLILAQVQVPVIFITAYPERLLTGDRPEPTFLISKPFLTDTVKVAISQALFFHTPSTEAVALAR
ncbi:MAG: response regulator [Alphaproteobacteria bacterium]